MFDILGDLSVDQDIVSFVADGEFVLDFPIKIHIKMALPCHGRLERDNTSPQLRTSPCRTHTCRFHFGVSRQVKDA